MDDRQRQPSFGDGSTKPEAFGGLRDEMNKLLDDFCRSFELPAPRKQRDGPDFVPDMDLLKTETGVQISLEIPGVSEHDVDVSVAGKVLTISGEKKSENKANRFAGFQSERCYGRFRRSVTLPFAIDAEHVTAKFERGVLIICVAGSADPATEARRIPLNG